MPVDSKEVDRDTSEHDGETDATHHRLRVKGEDEQESPEDEVNDRPNKANLDRPVHVWLFNSQYNLSSNSDTIKEVVDEAHIVYESVHITGAQHEQGRQTSE